MKDERSKVDSTRRSAHNGAVQAGATSNRAFSPGGSGWSQSPGAGSSSSSGGTTSSSSNEFQAPLLEVPQLALPKGGGAIHGIGEKFAVNAETGTGSVSVPIAASPGRSGFAPQLSLDYNSGSGNNAFGFGWSLHLAAVARKTDKGLPRYNDAQDSDIFLLSGAEDLMPALVASAGAQNSTAWSFDTATRALYGQSYTVRGYRPRVEGLFARIERWSNQSDATDVFWRTISKDNITSWFGSTAESRIADPADETRIFSWLIDTSYDDKGNAISYSYKPEDSTGVDLTQAHERNRTDTSRSAQRYVKTILYGNRTPYLPDLTAAQASPLPTDWCFELVFDYGEHDPQTPTPTETLPWSCRLDAFSTYRSTFEVRTYRLCQRVLMFHQFPTVPAVGADCLVRSTDLTHTSTPPADPSQPFYSYLLSVTQSGYTPNGAGGYISSSLPPVEFTYTQAVIDETVREADPDSMANLPAGMDGKSYRWVDLDGEGVSGILAEQGGSWFYKANLSPAFATDSSASSAPVFAPMEGRAFAFAGGSERRAATTTWAFGRWISFAGAVRRACARLLRANAGWELGAVCRVFIDACNGLGESAVAFYRPDRRRLRRRAISEDDVFWWHESLSTEGFGEGQRTLQAFDEEQGPKLVFSDGTECIFLADMSGDGLTDLVRVRAGEVCYWPNLGYGRFGAKVTTDGVPRLDRQEVFDARRVRMADIDGSGTADLIYFAAGEIHLYFSQSGNGYGQRRVLQHFPLVDTASSAAVLDLMGNGTACLVWSSPLAWHARAPRLHRPWAA